MYREPVATVQRIDLPRITLKNLEARGGFEPPHKGFADLSLTTWVPRLDSVACGQRHGRCPALTPVKLLERETGFEPATSTLARSHSTAELLPR